MRRRWPEQPAFVPMDTKYFGPTEQQAMLNLRVDDLDAVLEKLRAAAVDIDPKREDYDYGPFAWFNGPEGNRVELWQPPGPNEA
jgi:predicted enzyme related to lactoylglutathione lyase